MENRLKPVLQFLIAVFPLMLLVPILINHIYGIYVTTLLHSEAYFIKMQEGLLSFFVAALIPLLYILYKHGLKKLLISVLISFLIFNFVIYDYLTPKYGDDSGLVELPLIAFLTAITQAVIYKKLKDDFILKSIAYALIFSVIEVFWVQAVIPSFKIFKGFP